MREREDRKDARDRRREREATVLRSRSLEDSGRYERRAVERHTHSLNRDRNHRRRDLEHRDGHRKEYFRFDDVDIVIENTDSEGSVETAGIDSYYYGLNHGYDGSMRWQRSFRRP